MYYDYMILHVKLPILGLAASEIGRCISAPWKSPMYSGVVGFQRISYSLQFDHVFELLWSSFWHRGVGDISADEPCFN